MKILFLITPDDDEGRYLIRYQNVDTFLPLGIAQVAAVLEHKNHEVKVLDLRLKDKRQLGRTINNFKPDIIGIHTYFYSIENLKKFSRIIKEKYDIPIFVGGVHPALYPVTIFEDDFYLEKFDDQAIDFILTGEGEVVLPKLLDTMEKKKSFSKIKGLCYRTNKKLIRNKGISLIDKLDELPFPAFHLFNLRKYVPLAKHYKRMPVVPMITSRGCTWGRCGFCWQSGINGYYRKKSPKRVVDEIKYSVKKYGVKEVRFWDDTFFHNDEWINGFCDLMIKEKVEVIWSCHERVNKINDKISRKLADAGCWQILLGIESGNKKLLRRVGKGISLGQARKAVKRLQKEGIEARVSFILGLPGETPRMTDETIRFAKSLDADVTQFSLFTPYPGTKFYYEIKNEDRIDTNFGDYSEYNVVYIPKAYSNKEELKRKYRKAYLEIYSQPSYIWKKLKHVRSIDDFKRYYQGFKTVLGLWFSKKN